MAANSTFRSSLHGFNRKDVVQYLEYMTNQHRAQLEQLHNQLMAAHARIRELEQAAAVAPAPAVPIPTEAEELAVYRRAERTERQAQERARQVYAQANSVLAEATGKAEEVSDRIGAMADQLAEQLNQYRQVVLSTKDTFQASAASLAAAQTEE